MAQRVLLGEVERTSDANFFGGALQKKWAIFGFYAKKIVILSVTNAVLVGSSKFDAFFVRP